MYSTYHNIKITGICLARGGIKGGCPQISIIFILVCLGVIFLHNIVKLIAYEQYVFGNISKINIFNLEALFKIAFIAHELTIGMYPRLYDIRTILTEAWLLTTDT